jgi:hypothetical protein
MSTPTRFSRIALTRQKSKSDESRDEIRPGNSGGSERFFFSRATRRRVFLSFSMFMTTRETREKASTEEQKTRNREKTAWDRVN